MEAPNTPKEIINALGGTAAVARLMSVTPQVVNYWKSNPQFPAHTYLALKAACERAGIAASDALWRMKGAA